MSCRLHIRLSLSLSRIPNQISIQISNLSVRPKVSCPIASTRLFHTGFRRMRAQYARHNIDITTLSTCVVRAESNQLNECMSACSCTASGPTGRRHCNDLYIEDRMRVMFVFVCARANVRRGSSSSSSSLVELMVLKQLRTWTHSLSACTLCVLHSGRAKCKRPLMPFCLSSARNVTVKNICWILSRSRWALLWIRVNYTTRNVEYAMTNARIKRNAVSINFISLRTHASMNALHIGFISYVAHCIPPSRTQT